MGAEVWKWDLSAARTRGAQKKRGREGIHVKIQDKE